MPKSQELSHLFAAVVTMEESDSVFEAVDKLRDATLLYTQVTLRVSSCDSMLCVAQLPLNLTEWMFREAMAVHGAINKCFLLRSEYSGKYELCPEKTCLRGLRPGKTQTDLLSSID